MADSGFSTILGVTFDDLGGQLTIASNLNLPTAMTFGPDNKLYVANWGYGGSPGMGEILQIDVSCAKQHHNFKR